MKLITNKNYREKTKTTINKINESKKKKKKQRNLYL